MDCFDGVSLEKFRQIVADSNVQKQRYELKDDEHGERIRACGKKAPASTRDGRAQPTAASEAAPACGQKAPADGELGAEQRPSLPERPPGLGPGGAPEPLPAARAGGAGDTVGQLQVGSVFKAAAARTFAYGFAQAAQTVTPQDPAATTTTGEQTDPLSQPGALEATPQPAAGAAAQPDAAAAERAAPPRPRPCADVSAAAVAGEAVGAAAAAAGSEGGAPAGRAPVVILPPQQGPPVAAARPPAGAAATTAAEPRWPAAPVPLQPCAGGVGADGRAASAPGLGEPARWASKDLVPVAPAALQKVYAVAPAPVVAVAGKVALAPSVTTAGPPPVLYPFYAPRPAEPLRAPSQAGAAEKAAVLEVPEGQQKVKVVRRRKTTCVC
ncbi:unnamed protein product [Prorocentrum cordatum]|uniref:2'-phosphotransferase n=1 Tax=Prorocentrum cordatum TaxID=2364126 RepID=A0ABN9Y0V4_9DINO|nr:unnamed protein product [Polarella glacialis]